MENKNFHYSGFWRRFAAFLIDQIIIWAVQSVIFAPLYFLFGLGAYGFENFGKSDDFSTVLNAMQYSEDQAIAFFIAITFISIFVSIISLVLQWLYYALMESSAKQATLGKMALGIKVVDMQGNRIKFSKATGRYFGKILSGLIFYIGFVMAAFTSQKQALHDMLANCLVVINRPHYDQNNGGLNEAVQDDFVV